MYVLFYVGRYHEDYVKYCEMYITLPKKLPGKAL